MKTLLTILLTLVVRLAVSAEIQVAQINDKNGYTNIRKGQGTDFEIIGTVKKSELFYCEISATSDWYKVISPKGRSFQTGFIHRSRIKLIERIPLADQKTLIENILQKHKILAETFLKTVSRYNRETERWKNGQDSIDYYKAVTSLELHSDINYDPILQIIPKYFCKTKDETTILLFFAAMWADRGSANEMPSFSIGDCFICEPDLIIGLLLRPGNQDKKVDIINHIEWGLINHFSIDEDRQPTNPEYLNLKDKLVKIK